MSKKTNKKPEPLGQRQTSGTGATEAPQHTPGFDEAKHAKTQRAAQGAELLREAIFPSLMATALGFDRYVDVHGFKVFLSRLMTDLGNPTDPIERMLAEQLALMHFRVAALHASAGEAKSQDAVKVLNSACARLLGEFRRSCITLRALRTPPTVEGRTTKLKLFKMAK